MYYTERLMLRAFDLRADEKVVAQMFNDVETMWALSAEVPRADQYNAKKFIEGIAARTNGVPSFVICLKPEQGLDSLGPDDDLFVKDGKARYPMIGMLNLGGSPQMSYVNRVMRFGINFTKEHQGKGFGTEVLTWAMDYMFGSLGIHKCELDVSSDNPRAIRCYEKVGFVREGVLRSNYLKNGQWLDNLKMGLLEDEWRELRAGKAAKIPPRSTSSRQSSTLPSDIQEGLQQLQNSKAIPQEVRKSRYSQSNITQTNSASTAPKMSFDLEKGAGASSASVQQPTTARLSNTFPPTYEQHVNDNMRNFESEFQEVKLRDFDGIQDSKPKQRKRKCPAWVWLLTGISILLIISALLGGLIIHYMNKQNSHVDKVASQTSLATRSEETTTISPSTMTVYITQTPPTPSTQVVVTTLTPSTSTPSIVTVTSTTTASSPESTSTSTTESPSTTTTSIITTASASTSSINPSEAALSSSIAAERSLKSAEMITSPITTTLMSVTTATEVSVSTPPPEPSKTLIPMPGGEIGKCGVPGQACN
ncbi:hypothetical protein M409DRAFT_27906 [Zasmidium cellare ATCC 36951]|uniref:N-acetyltransferase domain-containing protein n=1 Tax=Zasmidium cellare ATCC 36951 TaxID=1080233 RepID=A0A6A6C6M4_ZASCE|nr:uncharacterized protein M409DRAFT_27906 [Zasmidium cellare ATCC 36951]KAF2161850.1 hypothetical protein M409DRAFT_27906 [Zasmidium cellare ATCC 36951]